MKQYLKDNFIIIKERLKTNPLLVKKRYPIIYFSLTGALLALALLTSMNDLSDVVYSEWLTGALLSVLFTILLYVIYILSRMLSTNFIIKNHRHTALFGGMIVGIIGGVLTIVRAFISQTIEIATIYIFAVPLVITIIYIIVREINGANVTFFSLGVFAFLLGVTAYHLVSFFLGSEGGVNLFIFGAGTLTAIAIFVIDFVARKKITPPKASLESLEARCEKYLDKVFKGLPAKEELFTLREQLSASLTHYLAQNFQPDTDEYKQYLNAIDSLGDYSAILYPYRKNILAKISGSLNYRANVLVLVIMQFVTTMYYAMSIRSGNWSETFIIVIFGAALCLVGLFLLRIIENFRQKRHKFTAIFLGIIVMVPVAIIFILISIGENASTSETAIPVLGAILLTAVVSQIIINVISVKKRTLKVAQIEQTTQTEQELKEQDSQGEQDTSSE